MECLRAIPEAPWRKYRGNGIDGRQMAHILDRFGVRPVLVRLGSGRKNSTVRRGYRLADVEKGMKIA